MDSTEFQVNTIGQGAQVPLGAAGDGRGGFVVAWMSENGPGSGDETIEVQRFDSGGLPIGEQVRVSSVTGRVGDNGRISSDPHGNFVVVWESFGSSGNDPNWSIQARRFDSAGRALDPEEFQVNTYTTSAQGLPRVAHDAKGSFVVVWESAADGSISSIQARRFDGAGAPRDPVEFTVNTYTDLYQERPEVAVAPDGEFVVVWESYGGFGSDQFYGVQARRFDADGSAIDPTEFQVNTYTTSFQQHAAVTIDPSRNFVVAWESLGSASDQSLLSVQARRFSWTGAPLDPVDRQVNVLEEDSQSWPRVASNFEGDFLVVWSSVTSLGNDPFWSIQARRFRANGAAADGSEAQINTYTTGFQDFPSVAMTPDGDFVAVWRSYGSAGSDPDLTSVQARRFGRPTLVVGTTEPGRRGPGCSLKSAITAANDGLPSGGCAAGNEGAVVELPAHAEIVISEIDNSLNGLPLIERPITLRGHETAIARDPGLACPLAPAFRIFEVVEGGILGLEGVRLANGCLPSAGGGAVRVDQGTLILRDATVAGNESVGGGGGLAVEGGNLIVIDSTVRGNLSAAEGGGIAVSGDPGSLLVESSTISENSALSGGGLASSAAAPIRVRNSTFSANEALDEGGALHLASGASGLLEFATVTDNGAPVGAGIHVDLGQLGLHGSLVGDNVGGTDCSASGGGLDASGANLDTDASCAALAGTAVATVASLELLPLADQGGPTRVHLPLATSAALDAAPACSTRAGAVVDVDQRRYPRPTEDDGDANPECELGAIERGPIFLDGFEAGDARLWSRTELQRLGPRPPGTA